MSVERMILGFNVLSDSATRSGGSWLIPLSNMGDTRPRNKTRSNGLALANTQFRVDLGSSQTFRVFAITHTNLSSAALYRITRYSDAFTTAIDNTGWLSIPGYPTEDPDMVGAAIWHIYATDTAARYWKFEFDDNTNPAGFIEIGRLIMPEYWQPPYNPEPGASDDLQPNTKRQNALGGTGYFHRRTPMRRFQFGFPVLDESVAPTIRRLRRICNTNKQVIIIPDPEDTVNFHECNFLGTLNVLPKLSLLAAGLVAGTGFQVLEVVGRGTITASATIQISASSQAENTAIGTAIGTLSVVGGSGSYTFSKTVDADGAFTLTGASLKNAISFDYETATFHLVTIQADNGVDTPISRIFTILVTDVVEGGGVALKADFSDANANEAWVFW